MIYRLDDEAATEALGQQLWPVMQAGWRVFLQGDLGSGKTTLTRALLRAGGWPGPVKSPTFTLVETYPLPDMTVYHFDLYRLESPAELEDIGIRDYFDAGALCLIEWPERGLGVLPEADLVLQLDYKGMGRSLTVSGAKSVAAVQALAKSE